MGEVYLADDLRLGRQVALKFLAATAETSPEARARLVREAQVAAQLRSPHVAVAYDLVDNGEAVFFAMEYVEGELLSARIARGPLPISDSLDIALQVVDALDEAHRLGIVHRDIKSGNLMLTARQLVKVLDFGLAKAVRAAAIDRMQIRKSLTADGVVLGTFNYMAPEQLRGLDVDRRADLFSLGVVLYEMVTGRLPFVGNTMAQVADHILNREPEAPRRVNPAVPEAVEAVILKTLQKDAARRHQSARDVYAEIAAIRREMSGGDHSRWRPMAYALPDPEAPAASPAPPRSAVAVLAFTNITGDAADDWMSQGIAESLTADFAKVHGLSVISREHIFDLQRHLSMGGPAIDERQATEFGRRLGATWVVSGAYQRLRERVRVTAQAIDVATGRSLTTVKLDGTIDGLFELQDQLVEELVRRGLERELETSERLAIVDAPVGSVQAFECYARGMLNLRMASRDSVDRAIGLFERALELDPGYVDAMVALGRALDVKGTFLSMPALVEHGVEWLRRAVAAKPSMAQAHIRLGDTLSDLGRTAEGIAEIRAGLSLDPDNADAHANLGRALWMGEGRADEAVAYYRRALELNPEAGYAHLQLALLFAIRGDLDEAEESARRAVQLQDQAMSGTQGLIVVGARTRLGYVLYRRGRYDEAIREYRRELEFISASDHALRERATIEICQKLAAALECAGDTEASESFFSRAVHAFKHRLSTGADDPFTRYYMASLHAFRGDADAAWHHLKVAMAGRPALTRWRVIHDPDFASVMSDPRFAAITASAPSQA